MLRKARALSYPDKWLLLKAILLALTLRAFLKIMRFKLVVRFLKRFGGNIPIREAGQQELKRFGALLTLTDEARSFIPVNCLSVSTAYWALLKRRGIKADLKFGMIKDREKLLAHAWLEYKGIPLTIKDNNVNEKFTAFSETIL